MTDRFDRARKVAEAYDKLKAAIAEALPLDDKDGRIDRLAGAIFELIHAEILNSWPEPR